jgi:hypothetical protein
MDNQENQQPQGQSESKIDDFLTDFNSLLKKHGIDEPILNEELDKIRISNSFELSFSTGVGGEVERLKCKIEWKDGRLQYICLEDI